ncbi:MULTISPECIES: hypothetical protein [Streptomyces]|uniref:hypothetical protein n=1 Tax=Streptomyces TaxID=1883 RepID=UPI00211D1D7F|nr:hypothetical protein [Streptomyces sp. ms184]
MAEEKKLGFPNLKGCRMDILTVLAAAAFGSTVYLIAFSTVKWLDRKDPKIKVLGLILIGLALCAVVGMVAAGSTGVIVGFVVGGVLTPPVHRALHGRMRVART